MYPIIGAITVDPIVIEASSQDDRAYIATMEKEDVHQVNGALIQGLYGTILERKDCDFGDIPASRGDITKVKYYKSTMECLDILEELMVKNNIPITDVRDVRNAVINIKSATPKFTMAFDMKQEYLIIFYNTIVMAVIDATTLLIAEYMNFIVGPEQERYDIMHVKNDRGRGKISLENLRRFNGEVKAGRFETVTDTLLNSNTSNFTGTGIVIAGVAIMALKSVVPITRELIFMFYRSRVSLSDYMSMQADFLESNALGVKASNRSAQEKKVILKKQEKIILKLRRAADKLKINDEDISVYVKKEIANDNKGFSLKNVEKRIYDNKMDGVGFTIV